ncbi:MerR family transcriptional regulator [Saccharospirillum salsuginis]|uniref:HTH merR-type domain-containing protein n=1 Tax=Saccharospirillum salsuginis TaxID=418750 RepID=A0A918K1Q3_9GAMM|nr:MerR family transcriptional regulator [Saccharospirillum salsuginis]GGX42049.1 hypothetical protein GCM10007392_06230 [Saccharospirillum salsuginis]
MTHGKRIGEVAELAGLSVHALRQWHRRYDIGPTALSDGGQRRYTESDIERIRLIQRLRHQGFSLATLAEWPLARLRQHNDRDNQRHVIAWCGPSFTSMAAQLPHMDLLPVDAPHDLHSGADLWVLEMPTLTDDVVSGLPPAETPEAVLWYEFANRQQLRTLEDLGYETQRGRPHPRWLLNRFEATQAGFSQQELDMLIEWQPDIDCECPNHLARILRELTGFARYSLECEVATPEEANLHRSVFDDIQSAQRSVLDALQSVLIADRISLADLIAQRSARPPSTKQAEDS